MLLAAIAAYGAASTPALAAHWGLSFAGMIVLVAWAGVATLAVPLHRAPPTRAELPALIAIAVALRIAFADAALHEVPAGDARAYLDLAASLNRGAGLQIYEPFIGATLRAFYPPLYPLVLAGWTGVAGSSFWSLMGLNLLIDGAAVLLITRLGTTIGRAGAGRSAAWLYAIWPSVLLSAGLAQKEGLCVLLIVGLANVWSRGSKPGRGGWGSAAMLGLLAAMLALTQPGQAPLAALIGLALIQVNGWRSVFRLGARALPFAVGAMLPWWLRNWSVFGAFVPLTSAGQVSLWVGNNPQATGAWEPTPRIRPGMGELDYARIVGANARAWIVDHPAAFARLTAAKFVRACGVADFGLVRLDAMSPRLPRAVDSAIFAVSQGAHLLLLGIGAMAAGLRGRQVPPVLWAILAAGLAQLLFFGVWFEFGERHREFLTPLLLLAIAAAAGGRERP